MESFKLYLVRHGTAEEEAASDEARALTKQGVAESRRAGKLLHALGVHPAHILTSPLVRAVETGNIIAATFKPLAPVEESEFLKPDAPVRRVLAQLSGRQLSGTHLLIGHLPHLPALLALLANTGANAAISLSKGAVACLKVHQFAPGGAELSWLLQAKQIEKLC